MGKIVGKITLFLILFCSVFPLQGKVSLKAKTMDGDSLEHAVVGEPFVLEVVIKDATSSTKAPTIQGIEQFVSKRSGMYMSSINGKSSVRYSYQVRIDKPGNFTIGPAVVEGNMGTQVSNSTQIMVQKEQQNKKQKKGKTKNITFLRLSIEKDVVVVGERVPCTLRFYYKNPKIELTRLGKPDIRGCSSKNEQEPTVSSTDIDGKTYSYVEWKWDLYPMKAGELIIPAHHLDYYQESKRDHFFGGFSVMFGPQKERKRVYSNAVKLKVDDLPQTNESIQAIGEFNSIRASIQPGMAKEGEGMVLAIELQGDGDLDAIALSPLVGIPEQLKYYDSNASVIRDEDAEPKKRFEYIVQGMQCGDWEIPTQTFHFFDVKTRTIKQLQTSPLLVTITPSATSSRNNMFTGTDNHEHAPLAQIKQKPLHEQGPWYPVKERQPLAGWLFLLFSFTPIIALGHRSFYHAIKKRMQKNKQFKKAFTRAKQNLEAAQQAGDYTQLYHIFIQLIAARARQPIAIVSSQLILRLLQEKEMKKEVIEMWQAFYEQILHIAFAAKETDQKELFEEAKQWINRFENIL